MAQPLNKVANPDFSHGLRAPLRWTWYTDSPSASWNRPRNEGPKAKDTGGMVLRSEQAFATAAWRQEIACRPGKWYRIEALVTCDLVGEAGTADEARMAAGCSLRVQGLGEAGPAGPEQQTPGVLRTSGEKVLRACYETQSGVRRLRLSIGIRQAKGRAHIRHVRVFEILEPDSESHPIAIPPLPYAHPAPRVVQRIGVCSLTAKTRPITGFLRSTLGTEQVIAISTGTLARHVRRCDAIILPDPKPPASLRSCRQLVELATERIVIVSLPAFARLVRGRAAVRRVEQEDDPIHARIAYANYATAGFALHDAFPFAWVGKKPWAFVQNQFRATKELVAVLRQYGFDVLLDSLCQQESTSYRPVCLFKSTPGGAVFVMDIEPLETEDSTMADAAPARHFLLSVLGQTEAGLGQYVVPARSEASFREQIRALADRLPPISVRERYDDDGQLVDQTVLLAKPDHAHRPEPPKPVILIRSGLRSGDAESVYAALLWLKQLVRPPPYPCPYGDALTKSYRFIWVPASARWELREGWLRSAQELPVPSPMPCDPAEIALLVDVISRRIPCARLVIPRADGPYAPYVHWIPRLWSAFARSDRVGPTRKENDHPTDTEKPGGLQVRWHARAVVDDKAFAGQAHQQVIEAGGQVVRIEIPGFDADVAARSIQWTDMGATLLEHVIGLQYGLIAVNRGNGPVQLDGLERLEVGEALIVPRDDPRLACESKSRDSVALSLAGEAVLDPGAVRRR